MVVPGEAYIIAGERCDLVGALRLAERITGVPGPRIKIAPGMMKATAGLMSVVERVLPVPDDYTAEYLRENAGTTYLGDSSKAKRELGFEVRPLEVGLAETLRHEMRLLGMPFRRRRRDGSPLALDVRRLPDESGVRPVGAMRQPTTCDRTRIFLRG